MDTARGNGKHSQRLVSFRAEGWAGLCSLWHRPRCAVWGDAPEKDGRCEERSAGGSAGHCRPVCGSSEEGRRKKKFKIVLKAGSLWSPRARGSLWPSARQWTYFFVTEGEGYSYSETVESEAVFILRCLNINKLLQEFKGYLKVYLKPGSSALAWCLWCLSAGKQSIRTICLPLVHSILMPTAVNEGQKSLVHARCTIQ